MRRISVGKGRKVWHHLDRKTKERGCSGGWIMSIQMKRSPKCQEGRGCPLGLPVGGETHQMWAAGGQSPPPRLPALHGPPLSALPFQWHSQQQPRVSWLENQHFCTLRIVPSGCKQEKGQRLGVTFSSDGWQRGGDQEGGGPTEITSRDGNDNTVNCGPRTKPAKEKTPL